MALTDSFFVSGGSSGTGSFGCECGDSGRGCRLGRDEVKAIVAEVGGYLSGAFPSEK